MNRVKASAAAPRLRWLVAGCLVLIGEIGSIRTYIEYPSARAPGYFAVNLLPTSAIAGLILLAAAPARKAALDDPARVVTDERDVVRQRLVTRLTLGVLALGAMAAGAMTGWALLDGRHVLVLSTAIAVLDIGVLSACIAVGRRNVVGRSIAPAPMAPPAPTRPHGLDPPVLLEPTFVCPTLRLPTEPSKRLPGRWTHCVVCGRPLTDAQSRFRGVGPTCFSRTRIWYPDGPVNPAHEVWIDDVRRLKAAHVSVVENARQAHSVRVEEANRDHQTKLHAWTLDIEGRRLLQSQHDADLRAWDQLCSEHELSHRAWELDPRRSVVAALGRVAGSVGVWTAFLELSLFVFLARTPYR